MSRQLIGKWITTGVLGALTLLAATAVMRPITAMAQQQDELTRKVKVKVAPVYPDVARHMNITGVVKVAVVVSPSGNLKSSKVIGGHPLLVTAVLDALRKWKFEAAPEESSGIVEFKFEPQQ